MGYGPGSLSSAYSNDTATRGWSPATTMNGMPIGPSLYRPDPKSGCSGLSGPIVSTKTGDKGDSGNPSTRVFQMLSGGRIEQPAILRATARIPDPMYVLPSAA